MGSSLMCQQCQNPTQNSPEFVSKQKSMILDTQANEIKRPSIVIENNSLIRQSNEFEYQVMYPDGKSRIKKEMAQLSGEYQSTSHFQLKNNSNIVSMIFQDQNIDNKSQIFGELTNLEIDIPQKVTEGFKMLGESIIDPKLIKMFLDCELLKPVKLVNSEGVYEGQWSHGIRNGFGRLLYEDGSYYEGFWVNNERHFYGKFVDRDGDAYKGEWFSDKMYGDGMFFHRDGTSYEMHSKIQGQSQKFKILGHPSIVYPDGRKYYGELVNGLRNGLGLFIQVDQTEFIGHYKEDKQEGFGFVTYNDKRTFEGLWINGLKNGLGEFQWPNGQIYVGSYVNDIKEGYGMLIYPNGQKYRGEFKEGEMSGTGRIVDVNGKFFEAQWENGKRTRESKIINNQSRSQSKIDVNNFTENPWANDSKF